MRIVNPGQIDEVLGLYIETAISNGLTLPVTANDQPINAKIKGWSESKQGEYMMDLIENMGSIGLTSEEILANIQFAKNVFGEEPMNTGVKQLGKRKEAVLPMWKYYIQKMSIMDLPSKVHFLQSYFKEQSRKKL